MNRLSLTKVITLLFISSIFGLFVLMYAGSASATVSQRRHSINLNPIEKMQPAGEYIVEVRDKGTWHAAGNVSCDRFYREQVIEIGRYTVQGKEITIRRPLSGLCEW